MSSSSSPRQSLSAMLLALFSLLSLAQAHLYMTYPGWRGDSLFTNGTVEDTNGVGMANLPNGTNVFPYGMQWMYPCGGMPLTTNRSLWPVNGGAVAFQPGWFTGHLSSVLYINLGQGTNPPNMSNQMVNAIGISGPTNQAYPGQGVCFPQVPLPTNYPQPNVGDNATIQVIMLAQHGAALYSCVDITFADPADVPEVNESNCANSSEITFTTIYATSSLVNAAVLSKPFEYTLTLLPLFLAMGLAFL
jgi:hypothetical protein